MRAPAGETMSGRLRIDLAAGSRPVAGLQPKRLEQRDWTHPDLMEERMRQTALCPFCGLEVIRDDAAQTVLHEAPVCARFQRMAHAAGKPEVSRVERNDIDAHLARDRERVRRGRS